MLLRSLLLVLASLVAAAQPRLLLDADDFTRIGRTAAAEPWAASVRDGIVKNAAAWPAAHVQRFGLTEWQLPPEGGQWPHYYVCPVHGVSLQFRAPNENRCPVDNRNYTGWPYDQVVWMNRHSDNASSARDLALAWQFTRNAAHARSAARILLAYADVYGKYPLKDVNNRATNSAARVTAQTLDEAVWLIPIAWAYDLISDSGVMSAAESEHVGRDLLRAAAAVIERYDAKMSNWQSWHNAAIGAVGFALDDSALFSKAIDGASGFRYQMRNSVFDDGLWYEGAWSYHFYALDPLWQLAEMAVKRGIDLWSDGSLRKMFQGPLGYSLPDLSLPNFNDSGSVNLASMDRQYEVAYRRYGDPVMAAPLGRRSRGLEALLFGETVLPSSPAMPVTSEVFPASGTAVLRAPGSDHYVAVKFGPHGGGHGHYDKLNFVSYARGGLMAADPGTQPYAAPTHETWDKQTVAHNTVVVDERTQGEATGELKEFVSLPGVSLVRATAGPAYRQASLDRTLLFTADYVLDLFRAQSLDGAEHRFDWVYHNFGKLAPPAGLQAYPDFGKAGGYQHLSNARALDTAEPWRAAFDATSAAPPGSAFTNVSQVKVTFDSSDEQAVSGSYAGRVRYDFTASQGYGVISVPVAGHPAEIPAAMSMMVWGDGSGHKLALRIYDSTDERFVSPVMNVTWKGWKEIRLPVTASWTHYLGDEDGVMDLPLKSVSLELTSVAGAPVQGTLYWDDARLEYAQAGWVTVSDFEPWLRRLRVWMLGSPATTVVAGEGLGPNLLQPVPFVMARRRGTGIGFVSLLEPYGGKPGVDVFEAAAGGYRIAGRSWEDRAWAEPLRYVRSSEDGSRRMAAGAAASVADWFDWSGAGAFQVDISDDGTVVDIAGPGSGRLRVRAPSADRLRARGLDIPFEREGEWVSAEVPPQ